MPMGITEKQAYERLISSGGYDTLEEIVNLYIEKQRKALEEADTFEDVKFLQGKIEAYRELLRHIKSTLRHEEL